MRVQPPMKRGAYFYFLAGLVILWLPVIGLKAALRSFSRLRGTAPEGRLSST